jgi:hypothetical protein
MNTYYIINEENRVVDDFELPTANDALTVFKTWLMDKEAGGEYCLVLMVASGEAETSVKIVLSTTS